MPLPYGRLVHPQPASHTERNIENCHRMHTRHKHLHDKTLTLPIHEHLPLHASQYKQKTRHPSHLLHKHIIYFNTPRLKTIYLQQRRYTTNFPTDPTYSHYSRHKNKLASYTYIVSRHLVTRGNNKIMRTPPPLISIVDSPQVREHSRATIRTVFG